ncbi:MAG: hypothetical protein QXK95_01845, partial [Nitrososphaerota archaeon]
ILLLSIFISLLLFTVAAYSVAITLNDTDIQRLGGTGQVQIICPAQGCKIDKVTWTLTGTPLRVSEVNIRWTPNQPESGSTITYTVYVYLYNKDGNIAGSGSRDEGMTGEVTTTIIPLGDLIDPKDIEKIEIIIVENTS